MAGASLRDIRRKIKAVGNIKKITRAMQMVAAAKLRKAQDHLMAVRPYADKITELLGRLAPHAERLSHPLFEQREVKRSAVVVFTGDKGLCGSYNTNMNRHAERHIRALDREVALTTVGRKGTDYFTRRSPQPRQKYIGLPIEIPFSRIVEMTRPLIDDFVSGGVDEVVLHYTRFVNAMTFKPTTVKFLPVSPEKGEAQADSEYIFEPDPEQILEFLVPRYVETTFQRLLLESFSSEFAARMNAMKLATDNAQEMIESLTLTANKARQTSITSELLDIVGGAEAISA